MIFRVVLDMNVCPLEPWATLNKSVLPNLQMQENFHFHVNMVQLERSLTMVTTIFPQQANMTSAHVLLWEKQWLVNLTIHNCKQISHLTQVLKNRQQSCHTLKTSYLKEVLFPQVVNTQVKIISLFHTSVGTKMAFKKQDTNKLP